MTPPAADELVLRGPSTLVRAAQADLLSTGAWALSAAGEDGPSAYAALFRPEGPAELPGPVTAGIGPLSGVVAL